MNYKRLETFVWVASLGNFRKAAERLHTTQPAISARISGLEAELGVKLFEREGGSSPIMLTSKGKELLPYVEKNSLSNRTITKTRWPFHRLFWRITFGRVRNYSEHLAA